ncbi:MAG: Ig-like domain-containing protein [Clostridiales Family XIII bacterium]|nr:Ig-like domain-containing protein [Clostridiales Family XIII bacterium]
MTGTVYFAKGGAAKTFALSFAIATPTDGGEDADFSDVTWNVASEGVALGAVTDDTLTISVADELGTGTVTVGATFNKTGVYNIIRVTPLTISVEAVDTIVFDGPLTATADSTSADTTVNLPTVKNAIGAVSYALTSIEPEEAWGRITFENGKIKVAKDANAGSYAVTVTATDSKGFTTEPTTIALTVTNANDTKYAEQLAKLQDIEDQIKVVTDALALLPEGTVDASYLAALATFASVTDPYEAMWNNGSPVMDASVLSGVTDIINAINAIDPSYAAYTGTIAEIVDAAGKYLTGSIDKTTFNEGTKINLGFFQIMIPSLASAYVDIITTAWDVFQGQIAPVTNLVNAATDFSDFVTGTDYAGLTDIQSVNAYIQNFYAKYAALDDALVAFKDSGSIFVGLIDGILANMDDLVGVGLGLADSVGGPALEAILNPYIDQYITDAALNQAVKGYVSEAFSAVSGTLTEYAGELPTDLTLDDILGYSAEVREALSKVAGVSALITGAVSMGGSFDLADYDWAQIDLLDDYLLDIYEAYLESAATAAGPNAAELRAKLDGLKDQLLASDDFQTAAAVYAGIVEIYGYVNAAIGYFSSDRPEQDLEAVRTALVDTLDRLARAAIAAGKEQLAAQIEALKAQVRQAAIAELIALKGEIETKIAGFIEDLKPYIEALKETAKDVYDAYQTAVKIYNDVKAAYERAVKAYEKAKEFAAHLAVLIETANANLLKAIDYAKLTAAQQAQKLIDSYEALKVIVEQYIDDKNAAKAATKAEILAKIEGEIAKLEDYIKNGALESDVNDILGQATTALNTMTKHAFTLLDVAEAEATQFAKDAAAFFEGNVYLRIAPTSSLTLTSDANSVGFAANYSEGINYAIGKANAWIADTSDRIPAIPATPASWLVLTGDIVPAGFTFDGTTLTADADLFSCENRADGATEKTYGVSLYLTTTLPQLNALLAKFGIGNIAANHWFNVVVEFDAHTPGEWTTVTEATCTAEGLEHTVCTVCDVELETRSIPKIAHTPGEWTTVTEATCTAEGLEHTVCTVCGAELETRSTPRIDHTFEWVVATVPTAVTKGIEKQYCSVCGEEGDEREIGMMSLAIVYPDETGFPTEKPADAITGATAGEAIDLVIDVLPDMDPVKCWDEAGVLTLDFKVNGLEPTQDERDALVVNSDLTGRIAWETNSSKTYVIPFESAWVPITVTPEEALDGKVITYDIGVFYKANGSYAWLKASGSISLAKDLADLEDLIDDAQDALKEVKTSEDGADLDVGDKWVTQDDKGALQDAIGKANEVIADHTATQDEIAAALDELTEALADFSEAIKIVQADKTKLEETINAATEALAQTVPSEDGAGVLKGAKWAKQTVIDDLVGAVGDALEVLGNSRATQDAVDAQTDTLAGAIDDFTSALTEGTVEEEADEPATGEDPGKTNEPAKTDDQTKTDEPTTITPDDTPLTSGAETPADVTAIRSALTKYSVVQKKSLSIPIILDLAAGETKTPKVTAVSSNSKVKVVSATATTLKIKGVKAGKAKVTVTTDDGTKKVFTITVSKKKVALSKVTTPKAKKTTTTSTKKTSKVAKLSVKNIPTTLKVGKTKDLKVTVSATVPTGVTVKFASSNKKVLTVDRAGRITALKAGKSNVTVKAGGKSYSFTVKVKK